VRGQQEQGGHGCHQGPLPRRHAARGCGTTKVGKTGQTGATGPAGPAGAAGPQGIPGAPASTKTYIVNWQRGRTTALNASAGVVLSGPPVDTPVEHSQITTWEFPVDLTNCALEVSTASQNGTYFVEGGPPPGPIAQVGRNPDDPRSVSVYTVWPGGTGTDFSLLVTCP
jgi:hypothetical protein